MICISDSADLQEKLAISVETAEDLVWQLLYPNYWWALFALGHIARAMDGFPIGELLGSHYLNMDTPSRYIRRTFSICLTNNLIRSCA